MADATIEIAGQEDLPTIIELHNQIYRPAQDVSVFKRRLLGRYNALQMIARVGDRPVGFLIGYEASPQTMLIWLCAVHADLRRQGIATQLVEAAQEWAHNHSYESIHFEAGNAARAFLALGLELGYDITGLRWDADRGDNVVICEKDLLRDE